MRGIDEEAARLHHLAHLGQELAASGGDLRGEGRGQLLQPRPSHVPNFVIGSDWLSSKVPFRT